jgi:hypothetical protein
MVSNGRRVSSTVSSQKKKKFDGVHVTHTSQANQQHKGKRQLAVRKQKNTRAYLGLIMDALRGACGDGTMHESMHNLLVAVRTYVYLTYFYTVCR